MSYTAVRLSTDVVDKFRESGLGFTYSRVLAAMTKNWNRLSDVEKCKLINETPLPRRGRKPGKNTGKARSGGAA